MPVKKLKYSQGSTIKNMSKYLVNRKFNIITKEKGTLVVWKKDTLMPSVVPFFPYYLLPYS